MLTRMTAKHLVNGRMLSGESSWLCSNRC